MKFWVETEYGELEFELSEDQVAEPSPFNPTAEDIYDIDNVYLEANEIMISDIPSTDGPGKSLWMYMLCGPGEHEYSPDLFLSLSFGVVPFTKKSTCDAVMDIIKNRKPEERFWLVYPMDSIQEHTVFPWLSNTVLETVLRNLVGVDQETPIRIIRPHELHENFHCLPKVA